MLGRPRLQKRIAADTALVGQACQPFLTYCRNWTPNVAILHAQTGSVPDAVLQAGPIHVAASDLQLPEVWCRPLEEEEDDEDDGEDDEDNVAGKEKINEDKAVAGINKEGNAEIKGKAVNTREKIGVNKRETVRVEQNQEINEHKEDCVNNESGKSKEAQDNMNGAEKSSNVDTVDNNLAENVERIALADEEEGDRGVSDGSDSSDEGENMDNVWIPGTMKPEDGNEGTHSSTSEEGEEKDGGGRDGDDDEHTPWSSGRIPSLIQGNRFNHIISNLLSAAEWMEAFGIIMRESNPNTRGTLFSALVGDFMGITRFFEFFASLFDEDRYCRQDYTNYCARIIASAAREIYQTPSEQ